MKNDIKEIQTAIGVTADGIIGTKTLAALKDKLGIKTDTSIPYKSDIQSNKSIYGTAGSVPLKRITPPYQLYYNSKPIETISVHELIADKVLTALNKVLEHYGEEAIHELKLDQYDGCYSDRNVTGGTSKSMHAWAIALDFCAAQNSYSMKTGTALFSKPEYTEWWNIWKSVGARSFGEDNGYDWMHIEFSKI